MLRLQSSSSSWYLAEPGLFVAKSVKDYMEVGRRTRQVDWLHMAESDSRMKSDAHTGVQRTKCFIEYKSGLEAEDSFQTEVATNEITGLDVELQITEHQGSRGEVGQQTSAPQEICVGTPVNK